MKQNLSQIQYEQLAREQFCNRLKEIPFVSDIEVFLEKKNAPLGDFKAKVYLEDSDEPLLFVIEVRSNGEKRFVNHFMEIVMRQDDKTHYIFMAPLNNCSDHCCCRNAEQDHPQHHLCAVSRVRTLCCFLQIEYGIRLALA